jgi:hypothetical protein
MIWRFLTTLTQLSRSARVDRLLRKIKIASMFQDIIERALPSNIPRLGVQKSGLRFLPALRIALLREHLLILSLSAYAGDVRSTIDQALKHAKSGNLSEASAEILALRLRMHLHSGEFWPKFPSESERQSPFAVNAELLECGVGPDFQRRLDSFVFRSSNGEPWSNDFVAFGTDWNARFASKADEIMRYL